jgi:lycopene beta-cyclase
MESKPVIILGGGLWGSLLAYRLCQTHPHLDFKIYTQNKEANKHSYFFREKELNRPSLKWLSPFITHAWKDHKVLFENKDRLFSSSYCAIPASEFEKRTMAVVPHEKFHVIKEVDMEKLLEEGSFVIDTRDSSAHKVKCIRQTVSMKIELYSPHGLIHPVTMDTNVSQKDLFRHMQYLPIDGYTLMVNDVRYSKERDENLVAREEELLWEVRKRWSIRGVIERESSTVIMPSLRSRSLQSGRVINLAGIVNPVTGDELPEAVNLIDKMIETSFRFGELKEIIREHKTQRNKGRGFSKILSKMLYHAPNPTQRMQLLQYLYNLPESTVDKLHKGQIGMLEITKTVIGHPPFPLVRAVPNII